MTDERRNGDDASHGEAGGEQLPPREDWTVDVVPRAVTVDDVDALLEEVAHRVEGVVADGERAVAQALDARYVVSERHLEGAFTKALRSMRRGENVADGPAMETLLYAAGTRQIDVATEIGPGADTTVVAIVAATTGDTDAVADALGGIGDDPDAFPCHDGSAVREFYDVADAELDAVAGDGDTTAGDGERAAALELLVRERVALLDVSK